MAPLKALMVKPDKRITILNGSTGIMGIKGDKGDEGSRGSSGLPGIRGVKGEQGSKGEKGQIVNSAETVFFCCCFFPPNQYFFSFQISIFALEFPFLRFRGRMAYQECLEFLAPQGRKDNKEKKELRESLVSRDRDDRGAPGKMGLKKDKGNEGSRGRCFRNSLNWPIYIISSVDKTKLSFNTPHRRSTTVTQLPFLNI